MTFRVCKTDETKRDAAVLVESKMLAENPGVRPPDIDRAPTAPSTESRTATLEDADFAVVLLQALSRMARDKSTVPAEALRHHADLQDHRHH